MGNSDFNKRIKAAASWWWATRRSALQKLCDKRLRWQRPEFHESMFGKMPTYLWAVFTFSVSPFVRTLELDAAICAASGRADKLKECLNRGVSPDLNGLMETAIPFGHFEVVQLLLASGANPNRMLAMSDGGTCLHEAAGCSSPEIVQLLLKSGADPNRKTTAGRKPLSFAYDRVSHPVRMPVIKLLEPLTEFDRPQYDVDDFLKMENKQKAYWALLAAIQEGFRNRSPAELRVMSLPYFTGCCWPNGFEDMYFHAAWAVIPCAELMEAIDEPVFAGMLWKCVEIVREFGKKGGCDPFDPDADGITLDDETESKIMSRDLRFHDYDRDFDELHRKTMEYVRQNRALFGAMDG